MRQPTTDKQRHWTAILQEAEQSGETLAEFARKNGFKAQTLYQWRSALKDHNLETTPAEPLPFSMVVTPPSTSTAMNLNVGNVHLQFDRLPEVQWLSTLISLQESSS